LNALVAALMLLPKAAVYSSMAMFHLTLSETLLRLSWVKRRLARSSFTFQIMN
jgi:hypothetical protein